MKASLFIPSALITTSLVVVAALIVTRPVNAAVAPVSAVSSTASSFTSTPSKTWEFNDLNGINIAKDTQEVYNEEDQVYTSRQKNVRAEKGSLVLGAHREDYKGKKYTSGWVDTKGRFAAEYGKWEATIKVPKGTGSWPAFWLLSDNQVHTTKLKPSLATWQEPRFYMKDGEIDIMEHYGKYPSSIEATMHTYNQSVEQQVKVLDATSAFHTYGVEITPSLITWTIDGKPYHTYKKTSSNPDDWPVGGGNRYFFILNLAMGGTGGGKIVDPPHKSWRMEVSKVAYYPYADASKAK